jgi:hypothetical protein
MGVDPGRGQDRREKLPQIEDRGQAAGLDQVRRTKDGDEARGEGPPDDILPVRVELRHVEVGVGIHEPGRMGGRLHPRLYLLEIWAEKPITPKNPLPAAPRFWGPDP